MERVAFMKAMEALSLLGGVQSVTLSRGMFLQARRLAVEIGLKSDDATLGRAVKLDFYGIEVQPDKLAPVDYMTPEALQAFMLGAFTDETALHLSADDKEMVQQVGKAYSRAVNGDEADVRSRVIAHLQPGETAKTLPGHHSGALAVVTHPERKPQMLMPDGSRRDMDPAKDHLVEVRWR